MHFIGIGTATPPARYTKADCLRAFQDSDWYSRLDARAPVSYTHLTLPTNREV